MTVDQDSSIISSGRIIRVDTLKALLGITFGREQFNWCETAQICENKSCQTHLIMF